ncbi:MAG: thiol:disulfide interchange protein DsbA/DsbL [Pseudoxanthomonas sp.]
MKIRHVLMLSMLLPLLAACSKTEAPEAPATPAATAPAPTEASAAATPSAPAEAAAPAPDAPNNNPVVAPQGPAPVAGTDYIEISGGQPWQPLNGKIEVVEMFNYICPACYAFDPALRNWKAKQPADVNVIYVPAQFRPDFVQYAKAFYAAESLGIQDRSHQAVYEAIHVKHSIPAEGDPVDEAKIAAFYTQYGVSAQQFLDTMKSFAVAGRINKANQFALRSKIEGTPSLVVNGKYLVKGRSWEDMLRIADHLIAGERAAQPPAAQ